MTVPSRYSFLHSPPKVHSIYPDLYQLPTGTMEVIFHNLHSYLLLLPTEDIHYFHFHSFPRLSWLLSFRKMLNNNTLLQYYLYILTPRWQFPLPLLWMHPAVPNYYIPDNLCCHWHAPDIPDKHSLPSGVPRNFLRRLPVPLRPLSDRMPAFHWEQLCIDNFPPEVHW